MTAKNKKYLTYFLITALVVGLVYYLFFSKNAPIGAIAGKIKMTEAQAIEESKIISNLIETEATENLALANDKIKRISW